MTDSTDQPRDGDLHDMQIRRWIAIPAILSVGLLAPALALPGSPQAQATPHAASAPLNGPQLHKQILNKSTVTNRTPNIPHPDHKEALPFRHSWAAHVLVGETWKRIHSGLDRNTVEPGTILGLRYSARLSGDQRPPRHTPTLDDICGDTPNADLATAAGVIIDFGRPVDARPGSATTQPQRMKLVCLVDSAKKTYQNAFTTAGVTFQGTTPCSAAGYPDAPCRYTPETLSQAALAADLPALPQQLPTRDSSTMTQSALEVSAQPVTPQNTDDTTQENRWLPLALVAAMLAAVALVAQRLIRV